MTTKTAKAARLNEEHEAFIQYVEETGGRTIIGYSRKTRLYDFWVIRPAYPVSLHTISNPFKTLAEAVEDNGEFVIWKNLKAQAPAA